MLAKFPYTCNRNFGKCLWAFALLKTPLGLTGVSLSLVKDSLYLPSKAESWFSHLCPYEPNGIERSMKHYHCGFIIVAMFEHQFSWISLSSSLIQKYVMYMTTFSIGSPNNNHAFSTNFLNSVKFYETHKNWCPQVFQKPY